MFAQTCWVLFGCFSIKLHSETQVSGHLSMSGGRSPSHAQNPLSGEQWETLLITHHALSPPPSHHHLYIIHLINWLQRFYHIAMSLKKTFVPKSDVKQWFTTTTTKLSFKWPYWPKNDVKKIFYSLTYLLTGSRHFYYSMFLILRCYFSQSCFPINVKPWHNDP